MRALRAIACSFLWALAMPFAGLAIAAGVVTAGVVCCASFVDPNAE